MDGPSQNGIEFAPWQIDTTIPSPASTPMNTDEMVVGLFFSWLLSPFFVNF
jgi:hypothetical protein